jgi:predicted dehydrogenase
MILFLLSGFGFMGRMHAAVLKRMPGAAITGVVDPRGEEIRPALRAAGWDDVPVFTDLEAALSRCRCDVVDICLPTDMHRTTAEIAFAAGKHVFCEKPIALNLKDAGAMTQAAKAAGRQFMVGHCIRFWPEYEVLKNLVNSKEYGALVSLSLSRRNSRPDYAVGGWVNDPTRCMGAALDMHIHDTDFVCHLLGEPQTVAARGVLESTGWNSIASIYSFGQTGPLVFAYGAWNYPAGWGFQMAYSAVFENGALDFDSRAKPTLRLTKGGRSEDVSDLEMPSADGYQREMEYFTHCLANHLPVEISTGEQAARSLAVTLAEIESAASGGTPHPVSN